MRRTALLIVAGLLGGVVIHIATVLAFPSFGGRDLWKAVDPLGPEGVFAIIPKPSPGSESIAYLDPNMAHGICRFDLSVGPRRIVASLEGFWSVGIFNDRGQNLYSLTSGGADREILDLLIARPEALTPLRRDPPAILEEAVVVDLGIDRGIAVIRGFVPDPTMWDQISAQLAAADCAAAFDLTVEPETVLRLGPAN
ncbi:MAG: DUF1254 domain-containing protein [Alphaproteobacteria bacterium]